MLAGGIGVAVGSAAGLIIGSVADSLYLKLGRDFLADIEQTLTAGRTALVAQIYEEDTREVDERLADLNGLLFRRSLGDLADNEYETIKARLRRRSRAG